MNNLFYSKLAFQNLRKNRSLYLPCLLSGAVIVMLFYVLDSICVMLGSAEMRGASYLELILGLSRNVCGFLSIVILFYINSFVMKQRKREFGLFCVLGMEKQHLFRVLFLETTMVGVGSILLGIIGGALFSQLLFLVLLNLVQYEIALEFMVPLSSIGLTAAVFAAAYLLVVLAEAVQIIRTNPIDLLHSRGTGTKSPLASCFVRGNLFRLRLCAGYRCKKRGGSNHVLYCGSYLGNHWNLPAFYCRKHCCFKNNAPEQILLL